MFDGSKFNRCAGYDQIEMLVSDGELELRSRLTATPCPLYHAHCSLPAAFRDAPCSLPIVPFLGPFAIIVRHSTSIQQTWQYPQPNRNFQAKDLRLTQ